MTDPGRIDKMLQDAYRAETVNEWVPDVAAARAEVNLRRGEGAMRFPTIVRLVEGLGRLIQSFTGLQPLLVATAVVMVTLAVPAIIYAATHEETILRPAERPPLRTPDAALAEPDITSDNQPVVLAARTAGTCDAAVEGATLVDEHPYEFAGTVVAVVYTYYGEAKQQGCAKLVKPEGSPLLGVRTHLALTLCGDANSCDHDWNAYATDAGPVVVPSQDGCMSFRVSVLDETGNNWLVRDAVSSVGCE